MTDTLLPPVWTNPAGIPIDVRPIGGVRCLDCPAEFRKDRADGAVMRGHRRRCPCYRFDHPTPAVCAS